MQQHRKTRQVNTKNKTIYNNIQNAKQYIIRKGLTQSNATQRNVTQRNATQEKKEKQKRKTKTTQNNTQ